MASKPNTKFALIAVIKNPFVAMLLTIAISSREHVIIQELGIECQKCFRSRTR